MIRQLLRFSGVGAISTLAHVLVALLVQGAFHFPVQIANFSGFCVAVSLSYIGHALVTFKTSGNHTIHLPRFIFVALAGLSASSAITYVIYNKLNGSFAVAMAIVAIIVPLMTFLGSKFWAFAETGNKT